MTKCCPSQHGICSILKHRRYGISIADGYLSYSTVVAVEPILLVFKRISLRLLNNIPAVAVFVSVSYR